MEPRDSSLMQLQNEDSALATALGKEAALFFKSGKYSDCVRMLTQLLQKKENDPKVFHNIAIAESFQDGGCDPKRLLEVLNDIKKKSEELAYASDECVEAVSNVGNKSVIGSKGASGGAQFYEFDNFVTTFNIALIWFCLHEYSKSFSILEPVYMNIEPIDEKTALQICLLLLDVALLSRNASRSADVICYLEKVFCVNSLISQGDNGSLMQQQSSNLLPKSAPASGSSTITDVSNAESVSTANASDSPLARTLSDETEFETLLSSLDISGQKPSGVQSSNDLPRLQADDSMSTIDLRLKLHLYKVQFLLLTRNMKAAKREVKLAMNVACGRDYSMALFLKSQLEYARGNHLKAIKLLKASSTNRSEMGTLSMYCNNLGCIYYRLGKHYASNIFFSKALNISSSLQKEKPLKLSTFSQDKSLLIIYNCGVQYLACGKPILAARCFYKATSIFYNRPLLWLRIAECCLMALEKGLLMSGAVPSDKSEIKVHVIGKGKWRQLVIEDGILRNELVDFVGKENLLRDDKQPKLSMSLARQSLLNAFHLVNCSELGYSKTVLSLNSPLEENESNDTSRDTNQKSVSDDGPKAKVRANGEMKEHKGVNSVNASLQSSISDYKAICRKENLMIKQALYADLAFIELELENPLKALLAARSLLGLPECFRIYLFLGNVYAAEALCLLNRPKEAAEHLLVYLSGGNVELPYSQDDYEQCRVEKNVEHEESNGGSGHTSSSEESQGFVFLKPEEARGALYANLAALSAMQGDLNQAHQYVVKAVSTMPDSPEAILTAIYVDLMCGRSGEALYKLRQFSHVRFHPGSLTLSGSS